MTTSGTQSEQVDNKAATHRWFAEVWNLRRAETIDELLASDAPMHGLGPPTIGPAGFKRFFRMFLEAFPDLQVELHEVLGDGDYTALRFSFRGTHQGESLGFPATNKPVAATGLALARWKNGKIVEGRNEFDSAGVIGALRNG